MRIDITVTGETLEESLCNLAACETNLAAYRNPNFTMPVQTTMPGWKWERHDDAAEPAEVRSVQLGDGYAFFSQVPVGGTFRTGAGTRYRKVDDHRARREDNSRYAVFSFKEIVKMDVPAAQPKKQPAPARFKDLKPTGRYRYAGVPNTVYAKLEYPVAGSHGFPYTALIVESTRSELLHRRLYVPDDAEVLPETASDLA